MLQIYPVPEGYGIRLRDGSGNISMIGTKQYVEKRTAFLVAGKISGSMKRSRVELVDLNGDVLDGVPVCS